VPTENDISADVIGKAPDTLDGLGIEIVDSEELKNLYKLINDLSEDNAKLKAENDRLSTKESLDDIKAQLIRPYANKVFIYLCCYSVFVAAAIILNGFGINKFSLDGGVLSVLSGSTAVAAIGLVGIVVKGLFK
jgi:hypothetical protein